MMMATEGIDDSVQKNPCSHDTLPLSLQFRWQPERQSMNCTRQPALQQLYRVSLSLQFSKRGQLLMETSLLQGSLTHSSVEYKKAGEPCI